MSTTAQSDSKPYEYRRYPASGHRSPCPALNTLANHGYIPRDGRNLGFLETVKAIVLVYNISYPLATFLTTAGFVTCGHISFLDKLRPNEDRCSITSTSSESPPHWIQRLWKKVVRCLPRVSLDLSSLSQRNGFKIAHDASFVHPNGVPSESPDPLLVEELLDYASNIHAGDKPGPGAGLRLVDISCYHARRMKSSPAPLSTVHHEIAHGECALAWQILRRGKETCPLDCGQDDVIPVSRLRQWFAEERLPDGWWEGGVRPDTRIGLLRTRMMAKLIGTIAGEA